MLALLARTAAAQVVTNGNFETWATSPSTQVEAPANWLTADLILAFTNRIPANNFYDTKTVTKSTDAHGGSFAASLNTLTLTNTAGASIIFPGFMVLGSRPGSRSQLIRGLPNAGSPAGGPARSDAALLQVSAARPAIRPRCWCTSPARLRVGCRRLLGPPLQILRPAAATRL
ncbi:MAG: hypothetical protein WKG07_28145 [Hymenobacter sp.]